MNWIRRELHGILVVTIGFSIILLLFYCALIEARDKALACSTGTHNFMPWSPVKTAFSVQYAGRWCMDCHKQEFTEMSELSGKK